MSKFTVGDRVRVKAWASDIKAEFKLTGVVVSVYGSGWYTVKHDDNSVKDVRKHKRSHSSMVGPRYDYKEDELTFECPLLRLVDEIDQVDNPIKTKVKIVVESMAEYVDRSRQKRRRAS